MSDYSAAMSAALMSFMEDAGITQAAVARHLNRSKTYVSQRLSGMYPLSADIPGAVADLSHLGVPGLAAELSERMLRQSRES